MAGRRKPPRDRDAWSVDAAGRWRDGHGKFVSHAALLSQIVGGTPDEVGAFLSDAATRVSPKAKGDYVVMARFEDVGWRTLSYATGLQAALYQAGDWLENQIGLEIGFYGKDPVITDVQVKRVEVGTIAERKRERMRTWRQTKKQQAKKIAAAKAALAASAMKRKAARKAKKKGKKR